jgi:uncharacterized protein (TIGR00730 family)
MNPKVITEPALICDGQPLTFEDEVLRDRFRVVVFGSARIKKGQERYEEIFELAKKIAENEMDIVTGGGPGIMEAANAGHHAGRKDCNSHSIGFTVKLPFEENFNEYLDVRKHFDRFSGRLDHFMALANVVVVMPGGVGTCLEFFYTWQLIQVKHMHRIPIILIGEMWEGLIQWAAEQPVKKGFISPEDLNNLYIVHSNEEALGIIRNTRRDYDLMSEDETIEFKRYVLEQQK